MKYENIYKFSKMVLVLVFDSLWSLLSFFCATPASQSSPTGLLCSSNSAQLQWEVLSNQMIVVQNNDDVDFKF